LRVASLRNPSTNADVIPTFGNATLAIGTVKLLTNVTDPTQWVPNSSNPTVGYPISGTSQIILTVLRRSRHYADGCGRCRGFPESALQQQRRDS
jgi:hypothetical protein